MTALGAGGSGVAGILNIKREHLNLISIAISAPAILLALTFHEFAHGKAAYKLGDDTAKNEGRLTLNPISHLDLIGTAMLFFAGIGWAKPVPVNPYNFRNPRRDLLIVSAAGPAANLVLAFISGLIFRMMFSPEFQPLANTEGIIYYMLYMSVRINIVLAFFNLIPLPPLDGSKIMAGMLRGQAAYKYAQLERYGPIIFIAVIAGGYLLNIPILWWFLKPFVKVFSILFAGADFSG